MKTYTAYAIMLKDGSWYRSHGKWSGSGCVQSELAKFPTSLFARPEAHKNLKHLVSDFPKEAGAKVMEFSYTIKEA